MKNGKIIFKRVLKVIILNGTLFPIIIKIILKKNIQKMNFL